MKKMMIVTLSLLSLNAFAVEKTYHCSFTLVDGISMEAPNMSDSGKLNVSLGSTDEIRLPIAKKSVKIKLASLRNSSLLQDSMGVTVWISDTTAVGPQDNEGYLSGSVKLGAKSFQLQFSVKDTFYNLVCSL